MISHKFDCNSVKNTIFILDIYGIFDMFNVTFYTNNFNKNLLFDLVHPIDHVYKLDNRTKKKLPYLFLYTDFHERTFKRIQIEIKNYLLKNELCTVYSDDYFQIAEPLLEELGRDTIISLLKFEDIRNILTNETLLKYV